MTPTGAVPALISRLGGRRVWALLVAATAVVVVAALTYAGLRLRGGAGGSSDRSVAVLTFETLSSDTTADAYLADGLADGISTALGQLARLKVTSRTAVRRIPDAKPLAPAELGEILGAAHLVGGTVQRVAGQVRVTVELVRARSGEQLWTGRYDTTAADLLGVQARIAEAVAGSVAGRLLPSERSDVARRPTSDPRAYDHYLRGKHQLEARDPSSLPRALAEFEAALRLDSGFTDAWAAVGEAYYLALNYGWAQPGLPVESLLAKGFAATDEALRRDSGSAAAWRARGTLLHFGRPRDPEASLAALERAVALEPSDVVSREWLETVLRRFGRFEAARGALEAMLSLDPRYAEAAEDLAFMELELRRYATAIRWSDSAVALNPARWLSYCWRAQVKLASGDSGGALRDAQEGVRLGPPGSPQSLAILAMVEARAGRGREARARLEPLLRAAERLDSLWVRDGFPVALGAVAVGERDRAIRLLERVRPRGPWLWSYLILPGFDPIRRDPRFRRIIDEARPPGARDPI